jgi:hypothetical protein
MTDEQELPAYPILAYQLIPDPNQPTVVALAFETERGHSLFLATREILEDPRQRSISIASTSSCWTTAQTHHDDFARALGRRRHCQRAQGGAPQRWCCSVGFRTSLG